MSDVVRVKARDAPRRLGSSGSSSDSLSSVSNVTDAFVDFPAGSSMSDNSLDLARACSRRFRLSLSICAKSGEEVKIIGSLSNTLSWVRFNVFGKLASLAMA